MLFFKISFLLILSVAIPFFFGFVANGLKSAIANPENGQTPDSEATPPASEPDAIA